MKIHNYRSQTKGFFLATAVFMLGLPLSGSAANYYMATNGSDANTGTKAAPWRTLGASDSKLAAGDTLNIRGGTYTEYAIAWGGPIGTAAKPVIIRNYPGETPIFDGGSLARSFLVARAAQYTVFDGLTIRNYGLPSHGTTPSGSGFWFGYSGSGTNYSVGCGVRNCTFINVGTHIAQDHAVYFSYGCTDVFAYNNIFKNISGAAIQTWHSPGVQRGKFYNNMVFGANWGVVMGDGAKDIHIYNNLFVGCNYAAVDNHFGGEADNSSFPALYTINLIVNNNIFYANTLANNMSSSATNTVISNNLFYSNTRIGTAGANSVSQDPSFVNYLSDGSGNYHLKSGSPAIDAGVSSGAPSKDIADTARPKGAGFDIGPYEYVPSSTTTEIVKSGEKSFFLTAHPNPFTSNQNIRLAGGMNQGSSVLTIYDVRGKAVHRAEFTNGNTTWNAKGLPIGAYLIRVRTAQGKQYETRSFLMK